MGMLIAYLLGILTAIKPKDQNRYTDGRVSDSHQNQSFPQGSVPVVCIPRTLSDQEQAEKKKKRRRKAISFVVRIGSLVILFIYAGVTILIRCATKKSADAAMSAADTARDTLIVAERPWIKIEDVVATSPLIFLPNGRAHINL